MIAEITAWEDSLAALDKNVGDAPGIINTNNKLWAENFSNWYLLNIFNLGGGVQIEPDPEILDNSNFLFTFNILPFAAALSQIQATELAPTQEDAANLMAAAWEASILTNLWPATLNVLPGAFVKDTPTDVPTNVNTFSTVTSVILDPDSIIAAVNKIKELGQSEIFEEVEYTQQELEEMDPTQAQIIQDEGLKKNSPLPSEAPAKFKAATELLTITVTGSNSVAPTPGPLQALNVPLI